MLRLKLGLSNDFVRFSMVGLLNTALGYALYVIFLYIFCLHPNVANAFSYVIAVIVAFFLYRNFVFQVDSMDQYVQGIKFAVSFLIAFSINQLILFALIESLALHATLAQIFAMGTYTVSFYILNKWVVFAH